MNTRLLDELSGGRPTRPVPTRTRVILTTAALLLLGFDLALLVGGAYLVVVGPVPLRLLGALLILLGLECRLRFPKSESRFGHVSRTDAPALFEILDAARQALGAPRLDIVQLTSEFNASCARSGLRRRTVLSIGLPLWAVLSPAGRQALLGHELGHLINGDPRSSFATQPALTTFARLAVIFDPVDLAAGRTLRTNVLSETIATVMAYTIFAPVNVLCVWAHRGLERVAARDHQRAEVYADALAVQLGGTAGAEELMRLLLLHRRVIPALRRAAQQSGPDPHAWRLAVAKAVDTTNSDLTLAEQASRRYDAAPYASHPPAGLRRRLVTSWPQTETAPYVAAMHAEADAQLHRRYERATKEMTR